MRMGNRCCLAFWTAVLLAGSRPVAAQAARAARDSTGSPHPSLWQAALGVMALNGIPWAYNWYVQRWPWAEVGTRVWEENLRRGFAWDDDCFLDNQLAHPYHGSLYLNSARSSGYGFWGSLPLVAMGSASWELFFENVRPSLNDFISTTLGGMAIGEVTYRLSSLLGSSRGPQRSSLVRQLGAFGLSPITRTQRLISGDPRDPAVVADSRPVAGWVAAGRQAQHGFVILHYRYGDPFDLRAGRPYDAFEFNLQLGPDPTRVVAHIGISGLLARGDLARSRQAGLMLGLYQHYDYDDLRDVRSSTQSVSGALLFRRSLGSRLQLGLGAHAETVLLGAVASDYGHQWRRDYDYGPGLGARLSASLRRDDGELLRLDWRYLWIHSVHGASADHGVTALRLRTAVPLGRIVGVGSDLNVTLRHSRYPGLPPVRKRVPETRIYLMWPPS